jgi:hypothetical protein
MSSENLDIQYVLEVNNKYMIKETSVLCTDTLAAQHWIFKHPFITQDSKIRTNDSKEITTDYQWNTAMSNTKNWILF